jgi:metal-sulfur cluster biosynthetic enzyme
VKKFFELASSCDCLDQFSRKVVLEKGTIGSIFGYHGSEVEICTLTGNYKMNKELFDESIKKDSNLGDMVPDVDFIWEQLKTVNDPEINVNIVDLGLVYGIDVIHCDENCIKIMVEMTLTSPICPLSEVIQQEVVDVISSSCTVTEVIVNFVWDPPWHRDMMTEFGRMELGLQ